MECRDFAAIAMQFTLPIRCLQRLDHRSRILQLHRLDVLRSDGVKNVVDAQRPPHTVDLSRTNVPTVRPLPQPIGNCSVMYITITITTAVHRRRWSGAFLKTQKRWRAEMRRRVSLHNRCAMDNMIHARIAAPSPRAAHGTKRGVAT